MPALDITAVDHATDQLTVPAHGLTTGDGPAAVRAAVDGTPPAPLAAVTDYWAIVVDGDTLKLAASSSDAMTGTAIDLTTAGTGALKLEYGIPYRRARDYVALAQVKSADLNAKMDALKAMHALLTSQSQDVWTVADTLHIPGRMASEIHGGAPAHTPVNQGHLLGASAQSLSYPITLPVGARITGWKVYARKTTDGSDTIGAQLYKFDSTTGTQTALGTLQQNNANAPGFITLSETGLEETIAAGEQYFVKFFPGGATAANHTVMQADVAFTRGAL